MNEVWTVADLPRLIGKILAESRQAMQHPGRVCDLVDAMTNLWGRLGTLQEATIVVKGVLVYVLQETQIEERDPVSGEYLHLWQKAPMLWDADGDVIPPPPTWEMYCEQHLGLSSAQASNLKRNFQVYVQRCGWTVEEMLQAGGSRLNVARSTVEKLHPNVPDDLVDAIRGGMTVMELTVHCDQVGTRAQRHKLQIRGSAVYDADVETIHLEVELSLGNDSWTLYGWEIEVDHVPANLHLPMMALLNRKFR